MGVFQNSAVVIVKSETTLLEHQALIPLFDPALGFPQLFLGAAPTIALFSLILVALVHARFQMYRVKANSSV